MLRHVGESRPEALHSHGMDEKGACSSHLYRFMFIEEPYTVRYKDNKEDELEYRNIALLIQSIQVKDVDKLLCTMELQLICRE